MRTQRATRCHLAYFGVKIGNNVESGDHRIAIDDGGGELEANVKVAD
jgi:hypothetical protein